MNMTRSTYVRLNLALALIVLTLTYLWSQTDSLLMPWLTALVLICPAVNLWDEFSSEPDDSDPDTV